MPCCSYICSSTSGWICMSVWPSSCLWAHVCVWVCISLSAWELMSLDDSLGECICVSTCRCLCSCVHLRTLCTGIFPMCSAMSLLLLVCVCPCGTDAHFCLHAYIWQYTHVSVQLCVCEGVPGSAMWVHTFLSVWKTCMLVSPCASVFVQYICGSLCPFVHSRGMCSRV